MPIPFSSIPEYIRKCIIEKFNLSDFRSFHQCSRDSYKAAQNVKTKFLYSPKATINLIYSDETIAATVGDLVFGAFLQDIIALPLRFENASVALHLSFTDEFNLSLMNFLLDTNSSFKEISFNHISCSMKALENLYNTEKIEHMYFRKLETIDILSLEVPNYNVCYYNITNADVNMLLKRVVDGSKNVNCCGIRIDEIQKEVILDGVPNILSHTSGITHKTHAFIIGSKKTHMVSIAPRMVMVRKCEP